MPAIQSHSTATTDEAWDAAANVKRLREGEDASYYRKMFAWADPDGNPETKGGYKFPHHEVSADGAIGAANTNGCSAVIAVLNGGRGGSSIPEADRKGVWNHVARHLRDAGKEPKALASAEPGEHLILSADLGQAPRTIDPAHRTVEVVFYSGAEIPRHPLFDDRYMLRLSLDKKHVRMDRLNSGAPVLDSHDDRSLSNQIGVIEKGWIENEQAHALLRFSDRPEVEPIWRDVQNGIIRNVSVGAMIWKTEDVTPEGSETKHLLATDWEPMEISLVAVPADPQAVVLAADKPRADTSAQNQRKEGNMPKAVPNDTEQQQAARDTVVDLEAVKAEAIQAERARIAEINKRVKAAGLPAEFGAELIDQGKSVDEASAAIFEKLASTQRTDAPPRVEITRDETDARRELMINALRHRVDPGRVKLEGDARQYRAMSLLRFAEECLMQAGVRTRGMTPMQIAAAALSFTRQETLVGDEDMERLAAMATSDFPYILANVANKTLRAAYADYPRTFEPFCRRVTVGDFKIQYVNQLSEGPTLEEVKEDGEFTYGKLSEARESYAIKTYGKILPVTRQAIINDDMGAFSRLSQIQGRAAARLESDIVWAIITGNPTMGDGNSLFDATNHSNYTSSGTAISVASLGVARKLIRTQTGLAGQTLGLVPKFLMVPAAKEQLALQYTSQNYRAAKSSDINVWAGTLTPIVEPRLDADSATAWYMACDPSDVDTIWYAYLAGQEGVYLETRTGFNVDGIELKARLDFGAKAIDWRGLYKNAGA